MTGVTKDCNIAVDIARDIAILITSAGIPPDQRGGLRPATAPEGTSRSKRHGYLHNPAKDDGDWRHPRYR